MTSVGYTRNDFNFFVPGMLIAWQLGYLRSELKKLKWEMIKVVFTISVWTCMSKNQQTQYSVFFLKLNPGLIFFLISVVVTKHHLWFLFSAIFPLCHMTLGKIWDTVFCKIWIFFFCVRLCVCVIVTYVGRCVF